jgi:hypothetical protein
VTAQPNLLKLSSGVSRTFFIARSISNVTLLVRIYTLDGELAAKMQGGPGSNEASWNASGCASGLYFAVVDLLGPGGGVQGIQTVKVLVLR